MTRSWIRNLFARPVTRPIRKAPLRCRPALEVLEDRCVPSVFPGNDLTELPVFGQTDHRPATALANMKQGGANSPKTVSGTAGTANPAGSDPVIVVNNPTDTPVAGQTDLREAIAQANTNGGDETILFDTTVFGTPQTINLMSGQLE